MKAAKRGFPDTEQIVNNILLAINTAFINKEKVSIENFGQFKPYKSKVKRIYNFQEKTWHDFDGTYTVKFIPCPEVRRRMNRKDKKNG
jgi:nucleoid DNA-binding protein